MIDNLDRQSSFQMIMLIKGLYKGAILFPLSLLLNPYTYVHHAQEEEGHIEGVDKLLKISECVISETYIFYIKMTDANFKRKQNLFLDAIASLDGLLSNLHLFFVKSAPFLCCSKSCQICTIFCQICTFFPTKKLSNLHLFST